MADIVITPDMTLNDVIRKYPSTMGVFNRFNVDSCCGGARTIKAMAEEDKVDVGVFIKALEDAAAKGI
jgi:iron-sulfur cluster repair protein YtfE (RIC family)